MDKILPHSTVRKMSSGSAALADGPPQRSTTRTETLGQGTVTIEQSPHVRWQADVAKKREGVTRTPMILWIEGRRAVLAGTALFVANTPVAPLCHISRAGLTFSVAAQVAAQIVAKNVNSSLESPRPRRIPAAINLNNGVIERVSSPTM
ncbi:hypothetical protein [Jannaschia seohaensis]|uniref:hypothetical protein n=1 Tax=Jannaschia seohaensis TaxID=475081 RepID=UPI0011B228E0|nr:hypothetical protein [Jannaschia seohaensis]